MDISILRKPRIEKHQRLFELIRQDNLIKNKTLPARIDMLNAPVDLLQLQKQAQASLRP